MIGIDPPLESDETTLFSCHLNDDKEYLYRCSCSLCSSQKAENNQRINLDVRVGEFELVAMSTEPTSSKTPLPQNGREDDSLLLRELSSNELNSNKATNRI